MADLTPITREEMFYQGIIDAAGGGSAPTPTLITKNITENGTYTASTEDADGYSEVTVNVAGGETFEVTITLADSITADKTYSEIMTAINAGSKVIFTLTADGQSVVSPGYYVFINADDASDKRIMVAWGSWYPLGKMGTLFLGINSDNEIQQITMEEVTQP